MSLKDEVMIVDRTPSDGADLQIPALPLPRGERWLGDAM